MSVAVAAIHTPQWRLQVNRWRINEDSRARKYLKVDINIPHFCFSQWSSSAFLSRGKKVAQTYRIGILNHAADDTLYIQSLKPEVSQNLCS